MYSISHLTTSSHYLDCPQKLPAPTDHVDATKAPTMAPQPPNDIYQYSLHSAYTAGLRDGGPPVAFLTNHGTHGIGYFEAEEDDDDEDTSGPGRPADMIQLDSVAYTIDAEGNASPADKGENLPYAAVTVFQPKEKVKVPAGANKKAVRELFERKSGRNTPISFLIRGSFKYLSTEQATLWDVRGVIFGFCWPGWQKGVSGEGLQGVFLSEDKRRGGRAEEFECGGEALVEWGKCGRFHLGFPADEEFEGLRL